MAELGSPYVSKDRGEVVEVEELPSRASENECIVLNKLELKVLVTPPPKTLG